MTLNDPHTALRGHVLSDAEYEQVRARKRLRKSVVKFVEGLFLERGWRVVQSEWFDRVAPSVRR